MWLSIKKGLDTFLETLTAVSMAVLTLDVTWQVITRFVIGNPSNWTDELATNLMIWVGLLGAAVALNRGAHLGIDYFVGKLEEKKRLITEIIVYVLIAFFSIFVMMIGGFELTRITFDLGQVTPAMKLPMGYVYLAVPIAGFFLSFYAVELLFEAIKKMKNLDSAE